MNRISSTGSTMFVPLAYFLLPKDLTIRNIFASTLIRHRSIISSCVNIEMILFKVVISGKYKNLNKITKI